MRVDSGLGLDLGFRVVGSGLARVWFGARRGIFWGLLMGYFLVYFLIGLVSWVVLEKLLDGGLISVQVKSNVHAGNAKFQH